MAANAVVLDPFAVGDRDVHRAFGIHNVHGGNVVEAALFDGLQVAGRVGTAAAIGGVALDKVAVHLLHQILDEVRAEVIALGGLSSGDLDGHASAGGDAQGLIDADKPLGADIGSEIDGRSGGIGILGGRNDHPGGLTAVLDGGLLFAGRCCK